MTTMSRGSTRKNNRERCIWGVSLLLGKNEEVDSRSNDNLEEGNPTLQKLCSSGMVLLPAYLKWKGEEGGTDTHVTTVFGNRELHK